MTPRERILALLAGNRPDQVPWFGDLDYWAGSLVAQRKKPGRFKESAEYIHWHRSPGVGFYLQGYFPFRAILDFRERTWHEASRRYREHITPNGNLRECWEYLPESFAEAPIEHLVKSEEDLPALRYVYSHTFWEPDYDFACQRQTPDRVPMFEILAGEHQRPHRARVIRGKGSCLMREVTDDRNS
jgi:hypothetical protein